MTAYSTPTLIYLGNYPSTDHYEGDYKSEYAHNLVGISRDYSEMQLVTANVYDKDHDGVMEDDECNPYCDYISYNTGSGTQYQYTDGTMSAYVDVTLSDGSVITVEAVVMQMQNGDLFISDLLNGGTLDNLEISNIEITQITGNNYSGWYTNQSVDNTSLAAPAPEGDGIVEGTSGDDLIDAAYTGDPEGDMIDAGDALLPGEAPDDDIVYGYEGNDTIIAGAGDDEVYGGSDNDTIYGNDGNDVLYGDSEPGGATGTVRESLNWSEEDASHGFTQNTGSVDVTFEIIRETGHAQTDNQAEEQLVSGIDTGGEAINTTSSMFSETGGYCNEADYGIDFSAPVENVEFRINDIDGDGVVTVTAYDADGNQITVNLTGGSHLTLKDTDGVAGADTADSNGGYLEDTAPEYSLLVEIPGPVARIEIEHDQNGSHNSGINVTDIYFDVTGVVDDGEAGNDTIFGGDGEDMLYGQAGDDMLDGGADADVISGGDGADTILGGAGDTVDGGAGGNDHDVLDLTGQGPFYLDNLTTDSNGNGYDGTVVFVDADGVPTGDTIAFTEIEEIKGDNVGRPPVANDDTATVDEDGSVIIDVLANDTDPDGDTLTVTAASSPNGDVVINGDGTITFTPAPNYNGPAEITYTVSDPDGNTDTGSVDVTVNPVNDDPVANDDTATVAEDGSVIIDVLGNDTDVDGDTLTVTAASSPNGDVVINGDGTLTFTPAPNYNGPAEITYTVSDGNGGEDTGSVDVTVTPVNDDPVANDDTATTDFETAVVIDVLGNDTDVDGDTLTVASATSPDGDVVINGDGTLTFTPAAGFEGDATITYTVSDGNGGSDDAVVTVTVNEQPLDGIVHGTAGDDLIDLAYTGDPEGDMIDAGDEILPGEGPNDDIILAGDGNDTIFAGEANDEAYGEAGDDTIYGEDGDDYLSGGEGNDVLYGGAGNDELDAGQGADELYGEEGDDLLLGGPGPDYLDGGVGDDDIRGGNSADTIVGGDGNDTVLGRDGDDIIDTSGNLDAYGVSGSPDQGYPGIWDPDANPNDDKDTVDGGAGDDTIITGDDDDVIIGGEGNDTIDAGFDDDTIDGGTGDDFIVGGEGNDTIDGGDGHDTIYGGLDPSFPDALNIPDVDGDLRPDNGDDLIYGGAGNDTIYGQDDNDTIYGEEGNDYIDGGVDNDTIDGGSGDDTLIAGQGTDQVEGGTGSDQIFGGGDNDVLSGGDDNDFIYIGETDSGVNNTTVHGGAGGLDWDTLDLTELLSNGWVITNHVQNPDSDGNGFDGQIQLFNAADNEYANINYTNIEEIIPCFTPGTLIATPRGEVDVAELCAGDKVVTRDNGLQEIRWVGRKTLTAAEIATRGDIAPIMIRKAALGNGLPERDMIVSPNHRMLVSNEKAALLFEDHEVLIAAKHLTSMDGVEAVDLAEVTYVHIMFDRHEVVLSDGTWSESFQPGDYTLAGIGEESREEIFALFPELREISGRGGYEAARRILRKHEAELLVS